MKSKYIYIDDESPDALKSIVNGFNDIDLIDVELLDLTKTKSFDQLKGTILEKNPDGLIIDLRLDGEGPNRLNFPATTLAQDLRTMAASGSTRSIPIILCSTSAKMRSTYDVDKSSHDLFDYKFEKSLTPEWLKFSKKLQSLSCSYNWLSERTRSIDEILNRNDLQLLDSRIFERFADKEVQNQVNDIAQFVIKELFHHPGVLIKENVLAARYGIDIEKSSEGWAKIKIDLLNPCKYSGVFSDGWERWWADNTESIFSKITGGLRLQELNAIQRIDKLRKIGFENLVPASPLPYCKSTEFWTICEAYKKPLDPLEGFKIYETDEPKPWQEPKYISFGAELERKGRDKGLRPHPSELERIKDLKEMLSK
jgi:hypothetical protein